MPTDPAVAMITEDVVRAAEIARTTAMAAGDIAALDVLFHEDLRYGHTSGVYDSKARYLEKLRTGELSYPEMSTSPTAFALLGDVAALWVEGLGRAIIPTGEKVLHAATLTLWIAGCTGRVQMIAHQSTMLP